MNRVMLEPSDEAGMSRALRVLVNKVVKVGRDLEREHPNPEREH